jgi:hypothetical protein
MFGCRPSDSGVQLQMHLTKLKLDDDRWCADCNGENSRDVIGDARVRYGWTVNSAASNQLLH